MLNRNQLFRLIKDGLGIQPSVHNASDHKIDAVVAKIMELSGDDGAAVAAASLERDVSSALIDLVAGTVLATLFEEEGGGRANISISPASMDHVAKNYEIGSTMDGMIRHITIKLREDSDLNDESKWREPSNRHGLVDVAETPYQADQLRPQAEPKTYDRPVWAMRCWGILQQAASREQAENMVRESKAGFMQATVENRWCLHTDCPTSGCNHDSLLRDASEVTS